MKATEMLAVLGFIIGRKGDVEVTPEVLAEGETGLLEQHRKKIDDLIVKSIENKMQGQSPPMRWSDGTRVITTRPDPNSDLSAEAKAKQAWGYHGVILRCSDSHGLCYAVRLDRYPSSEESWYLPTELQLEDARGSYE